jgi:2-polyprenyl-3-methyl-5-hydroxy-6-metoxy-1,4-benzoquinol methylase
MSDPPDGRGLDGPCRICGGPTAFAFATTDRNRHLSSDRFVYVRCVSCRTLALANVPPDLSAFYPADYYRVPSGRRELLALGGPAERAKLALLRPFMPAGRLLEIGPAIGAFLAVAQEAGYGVEAVEMDAACCAFLERQLGVRTIRSDDPAGVLETAGQFDIIAMWQVIEHLPDPRQVLEAAARALAPGGVLALAAPNPDALQGRVFGSRWTHIDAPRHLFLLPLPTLVSLGAQAGLDPVLQTTSDASARGWNHFGWRESLASGVRDPRRKRLMRMVGSAIALAIAPVERRGRWGATYTVVLRRSASGSQ